jgi:AraC family transcriptional regulator
LPSLVQAPFLLIRTTTSPATRAAPYWREAFLNQQELRDEAMGGGGSIRRAPKAEIDCKVEQHVRLPTGSVLLLQIDTPGPVDELIREDESYWLFGHGPRLPKTELCFTERWKSRHFEPVGRILLLPPKHEAIMRSEPGRQRTVACQLKTDLFHELSGRDIEWTNERLEGSCDIANPAIGMLIAQLGAELVNPGFASAVVVESLVVQMAVHLLRQFDDEQPAEHAGLDAWRLRAIDERLEEFQDAPSLSELAQICRLSVRQLSRGFRSSRGVSIGSFVAQRRMERAKLSLVQGSSVKSVAEALGFASSASFCNVFRRATGFAPGEYKQRFS